MPALLDFLGSAGDTDSMDNRDLSTKVGITYLFQCQDIVLLVQEGSKKNNPNDIDLRCHTPEYLIGFPGPGFSISGERWYVI